VPRQHVSSTADGNNVTSLYGYSAVGKYLAARIESYDVTVGDNQGGDGFLL
jgi:hypothetical protein